jgi:ribonuclease Z
VGDTARTDDLLEYVKGADALVIEATYLDVEADMAQRFGHLTASQAASLAYQSGVDHLYLTHISRRYSASQILQEASPLFGQVTVARDFGRYRITRTSSEAGLDTETDSQQQEVENRPLTHDSWQEGEPS